MYLTHIKARGGALAQLRTPFTHLMPGPPQGRLQCMQVVVQLLGPWRMHGLAGESERGSFTDTENAFPSSESRVTSHKLW